MTSYEIRDRDKEIEMLIISFVYVSTVVIVFKYCTLVVKRHTYLKNVN